MSFSKSFSGKAAVILAALAAFPAEQRKTDEQYQQPGVTEGHARQIDAGAKAITSLVEALPADVDATAQLYGHANADESGTFGFSVAVSGLPTPPKTE